MVDEEFLKEVEQYAKLLFTPEEISVIIGCGIEEFQLPDVMNAYKRGRLLSEAEIRESIITLAKKGSGPAQVMAMQILDKLKLNEIPV